MPRIKQPKAYLSVQEAIEYLDVRPPTFYKRMKRYPLIPDVVIGDVKGFTKETLRRWDASIPKRGQEGAKDSESSQN